MTISLRSRYMASMLVLVTILSVAFTGAMGLFVEVLEYELLHRTLGRELDQHRQLLERGALNLAQDNSEMRRILVKDAALSTLPPALAALPAGPYGEVELDGRTYMVGRTDVGQQHLYLLLDISRVEAIESRLWWIAGATLLAGTLLSAVISLYLSRRVMRPVAAFADSVAALDPAEASRLDVRVPPPLELQPIASAMNDFLGRLRGFIERERAFTGDVSHELRTPLSVIRGATDLLLEGPALPPEVQARLQRIQRAVGRMEMMTSTFLFLAREQQAIDWPLCSLASLADDAIDSLREVAAVKQVTLDLVVESDRAVRAPPAMVVCILQNLLANGITASDGGTVRLRVDQAGFGIEDSGPGVPMEELGNLFLRGYRGPRSEGAGLGLSIVRRLVDQLGWQLELANRQPKGAVFRVLVGESGIVRG